MRAFYDHWKDQYVVSAGATPGGDPLYRISFGSANPAVTVSEGQGYGMVIVALMAGYDPQTQVIFDGLQRFARAHPSGNDSRLMTWRVPIETFGNTSAFDGDADIAYALLLADRQWGSDGAINYKAEAEQVIAGILAATIGPTSRLPLLGDWVDPNGATYNQYTPRSSDFMPAHFRAYGRATNNLVWTEVISNSQAVITSLQANHSPTTGLLPDFIVPTSGTDYTPKPAPPNFLENTTDGQYYYNAGRDPWRLGTDALLNNDPISLAQTRRISEWIITATGGNPQNIKPGYQLDGTLLPPGDYFTTFFAAPLGVAAMAMPTQQTWLNAIYDAVSATHEDYYEDSVTLLCLLVMTGNYWDPSHVPIYLPLIVKK